MIISLTLCGGKILALKSRGQWDFASLKQELVCGYVGDDARAGLLAVKGNRYSNENGLPSPYGDATETGQGGPTGGQPALPLRWRHLL